MLIVPRKLQWPHSPIWMWSTACPDT